MLRTGRKGLAAATLLGDMLKGTAAVLLMAGKSAASTRRWSRARRVLGHVFPVWLSFKGGKGVATYIGVLIAVSWPVALGFAVIWAAVAALTRYSSLAGAGRQRRHAGAAVDFRRRQRRAGCSPS